MIALSVFWLASTVWLGYMAFRLEGASSLRLRAQ